jgi:hypothetical protein
MKGTAPTASIAARLSCPRFAKAAEAAGMDVSTFMRSATIEKIERRSS